MFPFKSLNSLEAIEQFLDENMLAFLYITQPNCSVCHGLQPQIENILKKYPKIKARTVNAAEVPEVAGRWNIFTAPVLLLFVDGKEYVREARIVHTEKFDERISKIYENVESI